MLDLFDDRGELATQSLVQTDPEDLADAVRGQPPEADLATSFEDLVNGEMAFENEVRFVNLIWPLLMLSFGPTWSSFRLLAQTLFFGSIPLLLGT